MIVVLEDDPRRIAAMRHATSTRAEWDVNFFDSASKLITWLESNLDRVTLLSLDRDLDSTAVHDESCGNGEDVADYLAHQQTIFPIIIHSSNAMRAPAMHMNLTMAGYTHVFLRPFQDSKQWSSDVGDALANALKNR